MARQHRWWDPIRPPSADPGPGSRASLEPIGSSRRGSDRLRRGLDSQPWTRDGAMGSRATRARIRLVPPRAALNEGVLQEPCTWSGALRGPKEVTVPHSSVQLTHLRNVFRDGFSALSSARRSKLERTHATHRHGRGQRRVVWPSSARAAEVSPRERPTKPNTRCATGRAGSARSMRSETSSTAPMPSISATSPCLR